ncbi:VRR-NUC domain-containing protein [Parabacteroides pacaensis]|uniref:VRR-NUC domain-containing protein n=1 Tax=Parabacteroides pacaensis TaxID=2086575 RepID=UPI000D100ADD|nr:VRR-NUC domain-containing protein [Parabacteroides pacaensis]
MKGEANLQSNCITWFDLQYPNLSPLLFAVPNGGSRNKIEAVNLKRQGVRAGVSDLILLFPRQGHGALLIEMKYGSGRKHPGQKTWQKIVESAGYKYVVCRSLDEFMREVNNYLGK